jgi:hypothetical protein
VEIVQWLQELGADEGDLVTIPAPNADFDGGPDQLVIVCGDWTGWKERRFGGRTLADALLAAIKARRPDRANDAGE